MSNQIKRNKQIMPKYCHMLNKFAINWENAIIIPVVRDWYLRMSGQFFRFPCTCIRPKMLNAQAILGFVAAIVAFLPVTNVYLIILKIWLNRSSTHGWDKEKCQYLRIYHAPVLRYVHLFHWSTAREPASIGTGRLASAMLVVLIDRATAEFQILSTLVHSAVIYRHYFPTINTPIDKVK